MASLLKRTGFRSPDYDSSYGPELWYVDLIRTNIFKTQVLQLVNKTAHAGKPLAVVGRRTYQLIKSQNSTFDIICHCSCLTTIPREWEGDNILYLFFTKSLNAGVADLAGQTLAQFGGERLKFSIGQHNLRPALIRSRQFTVGYRFVFAAHPVKTPRDIGELMEWLVANVAFGESVTVTSFQEVEEERQ